MDQGFFNMPSINRKNMAAEERKEAIEMLYPKFEQDIRAFVVDYGRTIRSLDTEDMLLLKLQMTKCEDCDIPRSLDVSVKMNTLMQFDQQKISREKALSAIEIKEYYD
jgi:hypothetical protein